MGEAVLGGETERTLAVLEGPQPGSREPEQLHRVAQHVLEDLSEIPLSAHPGGDAPDCRVEGGDAAARPVGPGDRDRMRGGQAGSREALDGRLGRNDHGLVRAPGVSRTLEGVIRFDGGRVHRSNTNMP